MNKHVISSKSWSGVTPLAPMVSMFVGIGGDMAEHMHSAHKRMIGARSVMCLSRWSVTNMAEVERCN